MQLTCPTCGETIRAENINVQELVAVCSNCDTVFPFKSPTEKIKRRKVKQPQNLSVSDAAEKLQMTFRTNWRLDTNQTFIASAIMAAMFTFITSLLIGEVLSGEESLFLPLMIGTIAALAYYQLGLVVYNKTHIEMDEDKITIARKPIPNFLREALVVSLYNVEAIKCEETAISKKEQYDMPRYRVWAETTDGSQRVIVNDVTEEYAYFIAQRLEEKLLDDMDIDVSQLEDAAYHDEDDFSDSLAAQSYTDRR